MSCPSCHYKTVFSCKIKLPTFEHRDLTKISDYIILKQCKRCSIIYNPNIKNVATIQKKIFLSNKDYNLSLKNNKISALKDYEYANEIFKLSNALNLNNENLNILDVGALQGSLLKKIRIIFNKRKKNNKKLDLVGYNYSNKKNFFPNNNSIINSLKIEDCFKSNKKYNIIIVINALQYVRKLDSFLSIVKNSLTEPNGFGFFVVPNSLDNISYNFHGDEFYKFTKKNIYFLFAKNGLKVNFIKNNVNPGHLMFCAKKIKNYKKTFETKSTFFELPVIKNKINNFLNSVEKLSFKFKNNQIKIFGYRINAVILYHAMIKFHFTENKIFFLTDDNVSAGKTLNNPLFLKKLIVYRARNFLKAKLNLHVEDKIILSYGNKRNSIFKDLLNKKYNFKKFITV